jgi:hypothetical protein
MHQDLRVRQRVPLAGRSRRQQELPHRRGHSHGVGGDVVGHELHHVVDGHPGVHRTAWGVDVDADVTPRVLGCEQDDLPADAVGDLIVNLLAENDDPMPQQSLEQWVPERRGRGLSGRRNRRRRWAPQGLSHVLTCSSHVLCH